MTGAEFTGQPLHHEWQKVLGNRAVPGRKPGGLLDALSTAPASPAPSPEPTDTREWVTTAAAVDLALDEENRLVYRLGERLEFREDPVDPTTFRRYIDGRRA